MLHHIVGVVVGAIIAYLVLVITVGTANSPEYVTALIVGGIVSIAWPIVFVWWLHRRAKARREDQISREVDEQLKAKGG